jgi:hypothetical protein
MNMRNFILAIALSSLTLCACGSDSGGGGCAEDETEINGTCYPNDCPDEPCPDGYVCGPDQTCIEIACVDVVCDGDQICEGGECVTPPTCTPTIADPFPGDITSDTTLEAGCCYLISERISIENDALLTVGAGCTLLFEHEAGIDIESDGALSAVGTATEPILFTATEQTPGYWNGLYFDESASTENRLEHVIVEYGGGYDYPNGAPSNVCVRAPTAAAQLQMNHTTLRHSAGAGFYFGSYADITAFSENTITENEGAAGVVHGDIIGCLDPSSSYTGNSDDSILVEGDHIETDQAAHLLDVPYRILDDLTVEAQLTIEPGVQLVFSQDTRMEIDATGSLIAAGTADATILLTTTEATPGYWQGLYFNESSSVSNTLQHAVIEYGGGYDFPNCTPANVCVRAPNANDVGRLEMSHTVLRHSAGAGFSFGAYADISTFTENTVTQNADAAGVVHGNIIGCLDASPSSSYTGNVIDILIVEGDHIETDQTMRYLAIPYRIADDLVVEAHLTVEPGVALEFAQGTRMEIEENGALTAQGTTDATILFTTTDPTPGYWDGLWFNGSTSVSNVFEFVTVEYAGGYDFANGGRANICLSTPAGANTHLTMHDSVIRHSLGYGLWIGVDAAVNNDIDDPAVNTYTNNGDGAVYQDQ